ncbi:RNA methyltransferase substrate-binding domain-containing protein, partial [Syntrophomonas wolfei]
MKELVFGINAVSEALKGQRRVYKIYAQRERQDKRLGEILT